MCENCLRSYVSVHEANVVDGFKSFKDMPAILSNLPLRELLMSRLIDKIDQVSFVSVRSDQKDVI